MLIWFIFFFVFMQVMLEKDWLPKQVLGQKLRILFLEAVVVIALAVVVGIVLNQPVLIVGTVTVFCGAILDWKYRKKFDKSGA